MAQKNLFGRQRRTTQVPPTISRDGSVTELESTSDENGYVYFSGLAAGTYTISETVVPAGYTKVADQTFTLSAAVCTADNPVTSEVEDNYLVSSTDVVDGKQPVLPLTGDVGTFILVAAGVGLLACAFVIIARFRKQKQS